MINKDFLECVSLFHREFSVNLPGNYDSQGLVLGVEGARGGLPLALLVSE